MTARAAVAAAVVLAASAACSGSTSPGAAGCPVPHGTLETHVVEVPGAAPVRVEVYLPPGARRSGRTYPALYLLHGSGADERQWPALGLPGAADRLIAAGAISPLVVVMPDIDADGGGVTAAVVPWAEQHLPVVPDAAHRAIGGISLGGGTALRLAAAPPYRYSRVGGHSAAVGRADPLARRLAAWHGAIWLDVGAQDRRVDSLRTLSRDLTAAGADPQMHVYPGGHNRPYWRAHVEDYLRFYAAAPARAGGSGARCAQPGVAAGNRM